MATNIELKQNIDTDIINKTSHSSVTRVNVGNAIKATIDYIDQEIESAIEPEPGPQGLQGVPGIAGAIGPVGPAGAVGPAGLTWRSTWVASTSYIANDAVGYGGASYYCILATSGTIAPNLDVIHWALLALQGATGAQGIQGPTGLTGATGAQGIQGIQGLQGNTGPIGNTGAQGLQGPAGNSGSLPYQVYTAYLEFVDGTTINSTVFQNTIGDGSKDGINDIAWSYHSAAQPKAIMTSAPFTLNKTLASNNIYGINMNLQGERKSSTEVRFYSNDINNSSASLSFVPFVFVEIKVYN